MTMARAIDADVLYAEITGSDNKRADQLMWEWYAEMVEKQPTIEAKQEWTSIYDRLPEIGKEVLVCNVSDYRVGTFSLQCDEDGFYWSDGVGWWIEFEDVTHWMPLPELPKEVQ